MDFGWISITGSGVIDTGIGITVTGGVDTSTATLADGLINTSSRAIASVSHHSTAVCVTQISVSNPSCPSHCKVRFSGDFIGPEPMRLHCRFHPYLLLADQKHKGWHRARPLRILEQPRKLTSFLPNTEHQHPSAINNNNYHYYAVSAMNAMPSSTPLSYTLSDFS